MIVRWKTPVHFLRSCIYALAGKIAGTPILVSPQIHQFRSKICDRCIRNVDGQCTHCTCFVDAKTWVSTEYCPVGWWQSMVPSLSTALRQRFFRPRPPSS